MVMLNTGAWYNDKPVTASWDPGNKAGTSWSGRMIGVADYDNNRSNHPIVLRVVTGTERDLFVGFNRKAGINSDVKVGGNEVTVIEAGHGTNYAQSFLKSTMKEGDSYEIEKGKSGEKLYIKVNKIDTSASPAFADVTISFGSSAPPPTPPPTPSPTPLPSPLPTHVPTPQPFPPPQPIPPPYDQPSETPMPTELIFTASPMLTESTTMSITPPPSTPLPTHQPTTQPTHQPTKHPTAQPTPAPTTQAPTRVPTRRPTVP